MRRLGTALLGSALLLAACADDGGPSAQDDRESATRSIAAFEAAAGDEDFEVDPDQGEDEDADLEFESEDCRELDAVLSDDGDTEGETAEVASDDLVRTDGESEETLAATVVVADADALADELAGFDDERTAPCIEEALTLLFDELAEQDDVPVEARGIAVGLEHPELGDDAVLLRASGAIGVDVLEIPFALEILAVQEGRRGVTVTYTALGIEPGVDLESLIDVLLDPPASA